MQLWSRKSFYAASTALTLSLVTYSAQALPALPVGSNLLFTNLDGVGPKAPFTAAQPHGWSVSGSAGSNLVYVDSPTPGKQAADPVAGTITTYGNPIGAVPGNYIEADGNPNYEDTIFRTITGLSPGQKYSLSFFQGASQQTGFHGDTTNQWKVGLGNNPIQVNCVGTACVASDPGGSLATSQLMTIPSGSTVGWEFVSVTLTAPAVGTSALLSFLAWGDNGSTENQPPMAFLAGVGEPPSDVPEPASMALLGVGLIGLGAIARRRRGKNSTAS